MGELDLGVPSGEAGTKAPKQTSEGTGNADVRAGWPVGITLDMPPTLVLWDVDGTLIDNGGVSREMYLMAFWLMTGREASVNPVTEGRTDFLILRDLLADNGVDTTPYESTSQLRPFLVEAMLQLAPDLEERGRPLVGVREALSLLAGVPTVIQSVLTGNIEANAEIKVGTFGLDQWLDLEVGGYGSDDSTRANLVGAARAKVANKYGRAFDETSTVLIGDTPLDVKAAHDGGARVIAVATGATLAEELDRAGADATLADLADTGVFLKTLREVRA